LTEKGKIAKITAFGENALKYVALCKIYLWRILRPMSGKNGPKAQILK
jgi:hypothetical protein